MQNNVAQIASKVIDLQDYYTTQWHVVPQEQGPPADFEALVVAQHKQNFDLWHEEDKAREPDVNDSAIALVKRNIDGFNQQRNDMITEIDIWLAENIFTGNQDESLPWNSETRGSIIDRLSIASLKLFHMHEQTTRNDASPTHIIECQQKHSRLVEQRDDLATALQEFAEQIMAGVKQNKLYRQYKMYNDPNLNPRIYGNKK